MNIFPSQKKKNKKKNDALGMCFKCILFMIIQDVLLASALLVLQWTSKFFEVVIVALEPKSSR